MQSLFQMPQVEILNFRTFTSEYVAQRYDVTLKTIQAHKIEHADEIVEGIHFIVGKNDRNRPITKWTLRGIIKLGMFICSKEAKNFRLWAEMELEKTILGELESAKEARARNLTLADKVISLEAAAKLEAKRVAREISSYKSQLSHKDAFIAELTHKLESRDKKINELATRIVLFDDHTYNPAFKELESLKDDMTNMHYKLTQAIIGVKEKLIARKD
ncbi:hypothetical protein CAMRE0001_2397 [Campylobacter rectus RM3267]|uniref:Uncharacterized protein n=2 Tax=Campylobacter rectus TaxID=203 RepID=A0A6G5QMJ0_CAMRE|nr:hypothetical protein [Campylobacter rectus]EEF14080.1 hypothetical protein CAMRE0001_2397 [Campylobacter rectus RM3267]QCD46953.1 hypothetical protein CRECT_1299 [Campylobacter rectus]UEB47652.1 hypothetical protein LK437_11795 [Campylobacter rectus]